MAKSLPPDASHHREKGMPRRALGRKPSALPLTRCDRARRCRCAARVVPLHNVKQRSLLHPRCILASGFFSFLFTFVAADPRARGLAERRETSSLVCVAQVTRDATLARHGPSRATGRPASRRSAVALSAQVPPPSPVPGPARRLHAAQAFLPEHGARLFVSAVTSRGRRHIPLRLQDRLRRRPSMSGICAT